MVGKRSLARGRLGCWEVVWEAGGLCRRRKAEDGEEGR